MLVRFGVDVGGTTIKIGMFDNQCKLLTKCEINTDKTNARSEERRVGKECL